MSSVPVEDVADTINFPPDSVALPSSRIERSTLPNADSGIANIISDEAILSTFIFILYSSYSAPL